MNGEFCKDIYYGCLVRGDLIGAIHYVGKYPDQRELHRRFLNIFEQEQYTTYEKDACLNEILSIYQRYYRDVFYLRIGKEKAEELLRGRLAEFFGITDPAVMLGDIEQNQVAEAFQSRGFQFLGGRTGGYYGPYAWKTTETKTYEVELPDGIQAYTVKLLDGFIAKSWIDYISFGEISSGGWSDSDGIIHCVKASYDFESENFKVSLLKHEAQHAKDLATYKDMSSEDLEYRAKLVELIYSKERNLLERFVQEMDTSEGSNGHSAASARIVEGFEKIRNQGTPVQGRAALSQIPIGQIQSIARLLYEESNKKLSGQEDKKRL